MNGLAVPLDDEQVLQVAKCVGKHGLLVYAADDIHITLGSHPLAVYQGDIRNALSSVYSTRIHRGVWFDAYTGHHEDVLLSKVARAVWPPSGDEGDT